MNIFIPKNESGISATANTIFLCFDNFYSTERYEQDYKNTWKFDAIGDKGNNDGVYFYKSTGSGENLVYDASITKIDEFVAYVKAGNGGGIQFKNTEDTILLTVVSNYIIKKLNTDTSNDKRHIENVVLDLSLNGGGANDDEAFMSSWFLGKSVCGYVNKTTGSKSAVEYRSDVNFDGKFDDNDHIAGLKRYCITSLASFSCGNLFPSQIYFSDSVKTFGQKSGGGTCCVVDYITPSGDYVVTSSFTQMSTFINGSFVDIDAGIDVDVPIAQMDFSKVYNRYEFCDTYMK